MGMTLDEHIKKAEEDAAQAESDSDWGFGNYFIDRTEAVEYAENCRQLAEWLKDYKRLLAKESGVHIRCGICKHDEDGSGRCDECLEYSKWEEIE